MDSAMAMPIGAALRQKGRQASLHLQAAVLQQVGQHRIIQKHQLFALQLQGHVPVAQVISGLQQGQGFSRSHHQNRFAGGLDAHDGRVGVIAQQPFAGLQRLLTGQLQQQSAAADTATAAPQSGAFIGAETQLQHLGRGSHRRLLSPAEDQGQILRFR